MGYKEKAADIIEDYKASINALKSKYNKDLEGLEDYKEDVKMIKKGELQDRYIKELQEIQKGKNEKLKELYTKELKTLKEGSNINHGQGRSI